MLIVRTPRLYKHKGNWHIVFYDPRTQKRRWISLATGDKRAADRRAGPMILAYERREWSPFTDTWSTGATIPEALAKWTAAKKREGASHRTIENTAYVAGRLESVLPSGITMDAITRKDIERVVFTDRSPDGSAVYLRTLRAWLSWCVTHGLVHADPSAGIVLARRKTEAPYFLSHAEAVALVAAAEGDQLRQMIRFAIGSGLRRGELVALRQADINHARGVIHVRAAASKSSADRFVPLSSWAREAAPAVPFRLTLEQATKGVRRAADAVGLPRCHLHTLRHTFASWLRMGGAPLDRLQYWLGHRTLQMTMVYAHIEPDSIKAEMGAAFLRFSELSPPATG